MRRAAAFAALAGLLLGSLVCPPQNLAKVRPGLLIGAFSSGGSYRNDAAIPDLRKVRVEAHRDAVPTASYALTWWTVDGGGYAFSRGDGYALAATIGQPDAGLLRGGGYTLGGGFWGGGEIPAADHRIYLPLVLRRS
jgi:hypothetical protein